ncbi:MAG: hypothetical protein OEV87_01310 [Phycisphaerae bacterium]|nr:hypothetical protein [Phycisphaerae bacterium]
MNVSLWLPSEPGHFKDIHDWNVFLRENITSIAKDQLNNKTIFSRAMFLLLNLIQESPNLSVSSLRVGSETCLRKMIDSTKLKAFIKIAQNSKVRLQVVLPPLAEADFAGFGLLQSLQEYSSSILVVANDLGTLYKARVEFQYDVIAGRLLWKRKRASRFFGDELSLISSNELSEWQNITYPEWINFLGVVSLEIDLLPQGVLYSDERPCAIHFPWTFISYGRVCYIGSLELKRLDKFKITSPCNNECIRIQHAINDESHPVPILRSGKGVYCLCVPKDTTWTQNKSISNIIIDLRRSPG